MYETFDHTADIGLRIRAADLDGLFVEAAKGLFSLIVENPSAIRSLEESTFQVTGSETDYLLFDWLNELLYRFETGGMLFWEFDVHVTDEGITATARGERADTERHQLAHEVKAITYHHLKVEETAEGWLAELIVDI